MMSTGVIPPLVGSCRLLVAVVCLLAIMFNYLVKFGLSTAIVCMRGTTVNASEDSDAIEVSIEWIVKNVQFI